MMPLDWLLPGFGHLRLGFRREAVKYLIFMGLWLAIVVSCHDRIDAAATGLTGERAVENAVALVFLALWPVAWILAARRGLRRLSAPPQRQSLSQWHIAAGLIRRNKRAILGLRILQ